MSILDDPTPEGKILALIECCRTHADRREFDQMPDMLKAIAEADAAFREAVRQNMDADIRQVEPRTQ